MSKYKLEDFEADKYDYNWYIYDNEKRDDNYKRISINILSDKRSKQPPEELKNIIEMLANDIIVKKNLQNTDVLLMARIELVILEESHCNLLEAEVYVNMKDLSNIEDNYRHIGITRSDTYFLKIKQYFNTELEKLLFG